MEFTAQDFADTQPGSQASKFDFTEEDFAPERPALPKINLSPLDQYRLDHPGGPPLSLTGPPHPEEVPAIAQLPAAISQIAGKALEPITEPTGRMIADWLNQTGIDPSATPDKPIIDLKGKLGRLTDIPAIRLISPELQAGLTEGVEEAASGLTAPSNLGVLPFAPIKAVGGAFGVQALASVPENIKQAAQARTAAEFGKAVAGGAANLGIAASIGGHLLPRTVSEALDAGDRELLQRASQISPSTEVHGDVQPQPGQSEGEVPTQESGAGVQPQAAPVAKATQVPLMDVPPSTKPAAKLTPEEESYIEAERGGIDVPVETVQDLPENEPFANQVASIDRKNNKILINPREFSAWLKTVPEEQRAQAVRSLLNEERIHLSVDDPSALSYWNNLSALEKAIERRRYTGRWREAFGFTPTQLGHEALRFRLQQLARMTPREIAEAAGREKWTVKAITALGDTVRTLREKLGTAASKEQLAILNRIQTGLGVASQVAANPAAFRKKREPVDIFTDQLILPPMQAGEQRADVRTLPTGNAVAAAADAYMKQPGGMFVKKILTGVGPEAAAKLEPGQVGAASGVKAVSSVPTFDEFFDQLKGQYGPNVPKVAAYDAWRDALVKNLMDAPGKQLGTILEELGLRGKMQSEHQRSFAPEEIANKIDIPKEHQAQFEEMAKLFPHKKVITPRAVRQWFGPALRRRYSAIGTILDALTKDAGDRPKVPWDRTDIGPEDINTIQGEDLLPGRRMYRPVTPEEAKNPQKFGDIATQGAAVEASGKGAPPRTVSKNLVALRDKMGRIILVSAWRDPRQGPKVTNPTAESLPGMRINDTLLRDYTPVSVMSLKDPAKGFRKVFQSDEDFGKWFGEAGIEGTYGLKTSMFAGPQADISNLAQGKHTFTEKDFSHEQETGLQQLQGLAKEEQSQAVTLSGLPRRPDAPLSSPAKAGTPYYRSPRQAPEVSERLPLNERLEAERRAREAFPYEPTSYTPSAALEARGIQIMPGARGTRVPGKPDVKASPTPAAFRKTAATARDNIELIGKSLQALIDRRGVKAAIPAGLDAADNQAAVTAINAKQAIRTASQAKLSQGGTRFQNWRERVKGEEQAKTVRESAIAFVSAGGKIDKLTVGQPAKGARPRVLSFEEQLDKAQQRAEGWQTDPNPLKRQEAKKDLAYIEKLREGIRYAKAHWNDPEFQAAAQTFNAELKDQLAWEKANGFNVTEHENYVPQRYEGAFWNDSLIKFAGRRLLGTQFRLPKKYQNVYEAIANGPYRMPNLDLADLAEHRIFQGARQVEHEIWFRTLTRLTDPTSNEPVARSPIPIVRTDPVTGETTVRYQSPSPDYSLVYARPNSRPMAVRVGYESLVRSVTAPSRLSELPLAQEAVAVNQMLKHGAILLWDTFHLGRMAQYAQALMGRNLVGADRGYSALQYRPADLAEAVRKGYVSKAAADWATTPVQLGPRMSLTRQQILSQLINRGLNTARISDALYKDAVQQLPWLGEPYHKLVQPYNNWLFNKFIPGVMVETAVTNLERLRKEHPNTPLSMLMRDVANDTNVFFGNMGRQGIFRNRTFQQLGQIFFLAPMWQEGLFQKEARFAARLGGGAARAAGLDLPYRRNLPAMGALGEGMGRGLASYFVATQIANLISRGHFTWQNPEKNHKMDAFVKLPGSTKGFWLSPLSVFGEITHDFIRLFETKPRAWDAITQMGENRLSPIGKALTILGSGMSPQGQAYSTTAGQLAGAASQLVPGVGAAPISLAPWIRAGAHALAPNLVSPNPPGTFARQILSTTAGIKTEVERTATQDMQKIARDFIHDHGLEKDTGWKELQTDQPNYTKLRTALRNDDPKESKKMLTELRKTHSDDQIQKAMSLWARREWTGSQENETKLKMALTDQEVDVMDKANAERQDILNKFWNLLLTQ